MIDTYLNQRTVEVDDVKDIFAEIYGTEDCVLHHHLDRYKRLTDTFKKNFGAGEHRLFSAPGRTELAGNHTDHNHGRVLAGSVNLDSIAAAAKRDDQKILVSSEGYKEMFVIDLDDLKPREGEEYTTTALIRGIATRFKNLGFQVGGFHAHISSEVLPGSGLSSSASIEVLLATIINVFFNQGNVDDVAIALIGQYAENVFFGKPCGLMDQIACSIGGTVAIDFKNPKQPIIKKVKFDFSRQDYSLVFVNTGTNHADLTESYAAIPNEMRSVAKYFGQEYCRDVSFQEVMNRMKELRSITGDRAILRALHFLRENDRVLEEVEALENGNFDNFLALVNESGNSSFKWLQNCYTPSHTIEQGISLALAITEDYLSRIGYGACRVHGGGFAGTIQVFMPNEFLDNYKILIESVMGENSALVLQIRPFGAFSLDMKI
jgi:galactokinase